MVLCAWKNPFPDYAQSTGKSTNFKRPERVVILKCLYASSISKLQDGRSFLVSFIRLCRVPRASSCYPGLHLTFNQEFRVHFPDYFQLEHFTQTLILASNICSLCNESLHLIAERGTAFQLLANLMHTYKTTYFVDPITVLSQVYNKII